MAVSLNKNLSLLGMCIAPIGSECGSTSLEGTLPFGVPEKRSFPCTSDKLGTVSNKILSIKETARTSYAHTKKDKKAQMDVGFNWIYIMIAGVVILLFFTGIIVKQKTASQQQLSTDVVRIMESIFTAAGVSEKTKNSIDIIGLADYTLTFNC